MSKTENELNFLFIPFSSKALNQALGGGMERGTVNAVYGRTGTGKTSLCLDLALNSAELGDKVLYIDADAAQGLNNRRVLNALRLRGKKFLMPKFEGRIREKLQKFESFVLNVAEKSGIKIVRANSLDELVKESAKAFKGDWDLVIIDSLTLFFKDLATVNRSYNRDNISDVANIIMKADHYAKTRKATVLVTLQRRSELGREDRLKKEDREREYVGGEAPAYHTCVIMECLLDPQSEKRTIRIFKNRAGQEIKVPLEITGRGIA